MAMTIPRNLLTTGMLRCGRRQDGEDHGHRGEESQHRMTAQAKGEQIGRE
ncbi:MAG: hypothetical protein OXG35_07805 [Acidobacteria bacterium]|nr:hypothetical protein [Acidobacteriota bacterium]